MKRAFISLGSYTLINWPESQTQEEIRLMPSFDKNKIRNAAG
jgi:hypothetical protein